MLIYLKSVTVNKYKSIQKRQVVDLDPAVTTIVGMNESGKTSFLQALAKTNYFNDDADFKFDTTNDFPRNELPDFEFNRDKVEIIVCEYEISDELMLQLEAEFGPGTINARTFSFTYNYNNIGNTVSDLALSQKKYLEHKAKNLILNDITRETISNLYAVKDLALVPAQYGDTHLQQLKDDVNRLIEEGRGYWDNPIALHLFMYWLLPRMPKFWYFDDYYHLDGRININELTDGHFNEKSKTAMVLFELARVKPEDIIHEHNYERFIALFESVSNKVTREMNKYWSTNKSLDIEFRIQDKMTPEGTTLKYLEIRVKSQKHKITLPLDRRSKGFNWFFSFIVWFSKVQSDKNSSYVILLDEPGLNLHATAQADLLRFIEDLSAKYQIIYTTHSPFMVKTDKLERIRTCAETDEGTIISNSFQSKDPFTLLPVQAALGFDLAPNLFTPGKHLLVENPSDFIYLTVLSNLLAVQGRTHLRGDVTVVPVGGLNKIAAFTALLQPTGDNIACLMNSFTHADGTNQVSELIRLNILKQKHIILLNEFESGYSMANIEDLFSKEEYIYLFNQAFTREFPEMKTNYLDPTQQNVIKQICKAISRELFDKYRPAAVLMQLPDKSFISQVTLANFERLFVEINQVF